MAQKAGEEGNSWVSREPQRAGVPVHQFSSGNMTDFMNAAQRSLAMAKVRGKETCVERKLRSLLHRRGFRFRKNVNELPGRPDVVLPKHRAVIFVHGCFWHQHPGCKKSTIPDTRSEFWRKKLQANRERDARAIEELSDMNWRVAIVWECELKSKTLMDNALDTITKWISSDELGNFLL
jgi:DNA mismatch endonuclease (patch repair protein)